MNSGKLLGCCFTIILATVRHLDFDGFNSVSLISSMMLPTISLADLADGRFSCAMAVVIQAGILFQITLKFSGQALKFTAILELLLLDRLRVLEVDSEDGGCSVVVLKNISEGSAGVCRVKHVWNPNRQQNYNLLCIHHPTYMWQITELIVYNASR